MGMSEFSQIADKQGVTPEEKFILLTLAEYAGAYFGQPFATISVKQLEERTCIPANRVEETLRDLEKGGHIVIGRHPEFPNTRVAHLADCRTPVYPEDRD